MKLLFIADPLATFAIYKDTTFAMMREAQQRGHSIAVCQPQQVMWGSGSTVKAQVSDIVLTGQQDTWFSVQQQRSAARWGSRSAHVAEYPRCDSGGAGL